MEHYVTMAEIGLHLLSCFARKREVELVDSAAAA